MSLAAERTAAPDAWQRYAHLAVVYVVWGAAYFAVKIVVGGDSPVAPLQLQVWRIGLSGILLIALAFATTRRLPTLRLRDLMLCAISGILMWVFGNGLAVRASLHATSAFIVMAMGMIPLWTILLVSLVRRQLPARRVVFGLGIGLVGLLLIFGPPVLAGDTTAVEPGYGLWTALVLTGAGLTWSLGTVIQQPVLTSLPPIWAAGFQMLTAGVVLAGITAGTGTPFLPHEAPGLTRIAAFLFLLLFGSVLCLISYLEVLKRFTPAVGSTFAYVNPVIGIALGWIFLNEAPTSIALAGMALILAGVYLVLTRARAAA